MKNFENRHPEFISGSMMLSSKNMLEAETS